MDRIYEIEANVIRRSGPSEAAAAKRLYRTAVMLFVGRSRRLLSRSDDYSKTKPFRSVTCRSQLITFRKPHVRDSRCTNSR